MRGAILAGSLALLIYIEYCQAADQPRSAREEVEQIRELARMIRQTENPSELTVQNLLLWLQGKYDAQSGARKARQQIPALSREYLPAEEQPVNRPRPFQKPPTQPNRRPQASYPSPPAPVPQEPPIPSNHRPNQPRPPAPPSQDITPQGPYPQPSDQPKKEPYPAPGPSPTPNFSYPTGSVPTSIPSTNNYPSPTGGVPAASTPGLTGGKGEETAEELQGNGVEELDSSQSQPQEPENPDSNEDDKHPPHIHEINVQCAKDMMTITIEFNRVFNGVIYSKGFYSSAKCRYVSENSGQTKYTFTVSLDSCGTQFVDQFAQGGQAYLENVLVLQNEAGIQEVWDTVRTVRCLWEGSIKQDLSVSLAIGMLSQEVVTFNGDTGKARLDLQVGRGPFAQPANGLVKIGELMTLVVYVEGDAGFDVVVRQCQARDATGENSVQLFDEQGCVLKPKLFGAFQKTRETGNTGATLIAYAFFSAFKFPDEMDLVIECNVELCKTDCEMCPGEQKYEPGKRRRRDITFRNSTNEFVNKVSGRFRVVTPEDVAEIQNREHLVAFVPGHEGVCMSTQGFLMSSMVILTLLVASSVTSAMLWLRIQRSPHNKIIT